MGRSKAIYGPVVCAFMTTSCLILSRPKRAGSCRFRYQRYDWHKLVHAGVLLTLVCWEIMRIFYRLDSIKGKQVQGTGLMRSKRGRVKQATSRKERPQCCISMIVASVNGCSCYHLVQKEKGQYAFLSQISVHIHVTS